MPDRSRKPGRPSLESTFDSLFGPVRPLEPPRAPNAPILVMLDRKAIRTAAQPRQSFPPHEVAELAQSIAELRAQGAGIESSGILQPLLVMQTGGSEQEGELPKGEPRTYRLIAGERRWRAAGEAGLQQVPAIVLPMREKTVLLAQLIENLQRRDLPPLEEAQSIAALIGAQNLSVREAARLLGKPKSYLSDRLALLKMGEDVQAMVSERSDTLIHAREVDTIQDPDLRRDMVQAVASRSLSLAQLRSRIRQADAGARQSKREPAEEVGKEPPIWEVQATNVTAAPEVSERSDTQKNLDEVEPASAKSAHTALPGSKKASHSNSGGTSRKESQKGLGVVDQPEEGSFEQHAEAALRHLTIAVEEAKAEVVSHVAAQALLEQIRLQCNLIQGALEK